MRCLQSISFSGPASLSPSSSSSTPTKASGDRIVPKLTRLRNLRYLSEQEITSALHFPTPEGEPDAANSTSPASSKTAGGVTGPQPLPLPEISLLLSRNGKFSGSQSEHGDCPLPSPEQAGIGQALGDGASDGVACGSSRRDQTMSFEPNEERISRRVAEELKAAESYLERYKRNIHVRSSSTTPFAISPFAITPFGRSPFSTSISTSPLLSPRNDATGEFFPYYYITPKANQIWSAPEMPTGAALPTYPDYIKFSSESLRLQSSPLKSPLHQGSCRSTGGLSSVSRRESNTYASVHPLPLPPAATGLLSPPSLGNSQRACVLSPPSGNPAGASLYSPPSSNLSRAGLLSPPSSGNHPGPGFLSPQASGNPHVAFKSESMPLNSQWQKGKLIGRGTFGSVYVATNLETGALCAMKEVELFPDDPKSIESMKQMQQEIELLSRLKHPNIVQYYGSEIFEDRFYIYLEYVHPGSINKYAREHCGAITESVVRSFTRHILSGLAYLHSQKTIHRDIKGANLLVDASGVVKLADFGMAKHLSGQSFDLSLKGSPYWMAPELMNSVMQSDSNSDIALAVDIWSLGCTIIEMLTGKPPWSQYEGAAAMFKILKDTPPIPDSLSPEGMDFLHLCFHRNPADRPSAAVLLEHRFIKTLQLYDNPSSRQASTSAKFMDLPLSPSQQLVRNVIEPLAYPDPRQSNTGFDGDNGWQCHYRASDVGLPRISPRSILEVLPTLSREGSSDEPTTSSNTAPQ